MSNTPPSEITVSLWQRRWRVFRSRPMGFWSLLVLCALLLTSLLSNLLANDRPLLVVYDSDIYFPFVQSIPETTFGGIFPTEADYQDPQVRALIASNGFALYPPVPYSPIKPASDLNNPAPTPPDLNHWLGTDSFGRDLLARLIYGTRSALIFGLLGSVAITILGVFVGLIQGYWGGWVDLLGQRAIEIWSGLPAFFILIIISSAINVNFAVLLTLIIIFNWTALVGLVRAETLRTRKNYYILAAISLGLPTWRVLTRHILPNALTATITMIPFLPLSVIGTLASLDFIGFGLPLNVPSLGEMARLGKENPQAPWIALTAFASLFVLFTLFALVGQAVREALDQHSA